MPVPPQMELPLEKAPNPEVRRQSLLLADQFLRFLDQEGYRLEIGTDAAMRICGVQEGELFFAMRCKVFKIEKQEK